MIIVQTLFAHKWNKPTPYISYLHDTDTKKTSSIKLFMPKSGMTLKEATDNAKMVRDIIETNDTSVNNFKDHIEAFDISLMHDRKTFSRTENTLATEDIAASSTQALKELKHAINTKPERWQEILGRSHIAYSFLERQGISDGLNTLYPKYSTDTYSGRSKTTGYNIQGSTDDFLHHANPTYDVFVHLDWIAADMRMASILSGDKEMQNSFIDSDPYTKMAADVGVDRKECKITLMKAINSMDYNDPALDYYPTMKEWMRKCSDGFDSNQCLESILGRKFKMDEGRSKLSAFNACMQGSVAHAMQNTIYKVVNEFPQHAICEIQDSIVLACDKSMVNHIVSKVGEIMYRPLDMLDSNPTFPVKVSIGLKWRQWKKMKEIR